MILISHRGNLDGPDARRENQPWAIKDCLAKGFNVEIDFWVINGQMYLGHDGPETPVTHHLELFDERLWIHCKNMEALVFMTKTNSKGNYFWHEQEKFVLTSKGYIWPYLNVIIENGILNQPTFNPKIINPNHIAGICSDHIHSVFDDGLYERKEIYVNANATAGQVEYVSKCPCPQTRVCPSPKGGFLETQEGGGGCGCNC